jgi:uroporphyrinogen-III synthase
LKVYFTGLRSTLRRLEPHLAGHRLVHVPLLAPGPLDEGLRRLRRLLHEGPRIGALAFTSKTSVEIALSASPEIKRFEGPVFAMGPGTRAALKERGLKEVLMPEGHNTGSLTSFILSRLGGATVLVLCSSSSPLIAAAPGHWLVLPLYELRIDESEAERLARLCRGERAAIVVTSALAAEALVRHREAFGQARLFAISERVASRLREGGLEPYWTFSGRDMGLFPQALKQALEPLGR